MTLALGWPVPRTLGRDELAVVGRVARAMARRLWNRPNVCDLESLGLVVLCDAARHHDPSRSAFTPYLVGRLRWAMVSDARRLARRERLLDEATGTRRVARGEATDHEGDCEAPEENGEPHVDPEVATDQRRLHERLHKALSALPAETRAVLVGHYFGGQSLEFLAIEVERSKATVTRIHQAGLRQMAAMLSPQFSASPSAPPP